MGGHPDPAVGGPLDRGAALALLDRAEELLDAGELDEALRHYRRVVGFDDPAITAAALLGIGTALLRSDREEEAVGAWRAVLELPETQGTYLALRQLAAAYVRMDRLREAVGAYREAERRAPAEDRAEIAARLGWLTKELGDERGSGRYFRRSRSGAGARPALTYVIIGVTIAVSVLASLPGFGVLYDLLQLDKRAVAEGEYWRLATCMLLHAPLFGNPLHLIFNMYALSFAGGLVERLYGARTMFAMYLVTGIAASTASFVFGSEIPSVGASGAIFGTFGILVAASRAHRPIVDRESQAVLGQIGVLVLINLVLGFVIPRVDTWAHIGGLLAGLWLGVVVVPGRVRTLAGLWRRRGEHDPAGPAVVALLGLLALLALILVGLAAGTAFRLATG